ncbi:MAG: Bifunctional homocysteine S-methyltransferase/5,10-methylenetetrahydrofolate reductase [Anaerolineae bacterium]|nr:Bifunctional homocysteine S-methyltransferase/5,10-methylenetetrahydrofolate reductase [Anaerolineae bacterium]
MTESFRAVLARGEILVADGATGTNYQARGLERGQAPEQWLYEHPDRVTQLHRDFIQAGSNVILTNTFGATAVRLAHAGLADDAVQVNQRAVALARRAIQGERVWVAGSLGPSGQLLEPFGSLTREQAITEFAAQARALADGGVDLLIIETQFDLGEATAAFEGARSVTDLPIIVSFSFDMGAHTMMGLEAAQVAQAVTALGADMVGVNCGRSLDENLSNLREMRAATHLPLWMKPNAGLPRMTDDDVALYDVTPEMMGAAAEQWLAAGARIVGGCCGTSPQHLREIARAAERLRVGV